MGGFTFPCEGHDEESGNHPTEFTLRSYSCSENPISRSDSGTQFISFWKSLNERRCTNRFAFNWKRLHVLLGKNSETNKFHPKETSRTWYWFECDKIFRNRDRLASESVNQSKRKCEEMEIPVEKRIRRKKKLPGKKKKHDVCQTLVQKVKSRSTRQWTWKNDLTVFAGLSLQTILEDTKGESERKFKLISSEYGVD